MHKFQKGTAFYEVTSDYEVIAYIYSHREGNSFFLENESGTQLKVGKLRFEEMSLSKVMVLTEVQELLLKKLKRINSELTKHKIKFMPEKATKEETDQETINDILNQIKKLNSLAKLLE